MINEYTYLVSRKGDQEIYPSCIAPCSSNPPRPWTLGL